MSARAEAGERRAVRYTFRERVTHAVAAVSYVYLLLTGLAFWTPALFWLAVVLGGGFLSRVLHPWVGLLFSATLAWMFVTWRRDMKATPGDREWNKALLAYITNRDDQVPPAGRFNAGQKQFFWLTFWATIVLLVSGIVLWFPQRMPAELGVVRQVAVFIHAVASLFSIAGIIVHIYMGVAVVPGGLHAIVSGDVSEEWARSHHALWADEVVRPQGRTSAAPSSPATSDAGARR